MLADVTGFSTCFPKIEGITGSPGSQSVVLEDRQCEVALGGDTIVVEFCIIFTPTPVSSLVSLFQGREFSNEVISSVVCTDVTQYTTIPDTPYFDPIPPTSHPHSVTQHVSIVPSGLTVSGPPPLLVRHPQTHPAEDQKRMDTMDVTKTKTSTYHESSTGLLKSRAGRPDGSPPNGPCRRTKARLRLLHSIALRPPGRLSSGQSRAPAPTPLLEHSYLLSGPSTPLSLSSVL